MDLVSVVITTHNRKEFLEQAIESVMNQTYSNIQCIIVDDASTDGTENFVKNKYKSSIEYIRIEKSKGGNHARNVGLLACKGKYIALLDDDDIWNESKIEKQVNLLKSDNHIGLVYCGMCVFNDEGINTLQDLGKLKRGDLSRYVLIKKICLTSSIMFKSNLVFEDKILFDEELKFWQEYEFMIRVAQKYEIDFVPECLLMYRIYGKKKKSVSLTSKLDGWQSSVKYIYHKHNILYNKLNKYELAERDFIYYCEGISRSKSVGNVKAMLGFSINLLFHIGTLKVLVHKITEKISRV